MTNEEKIQKQIEFIIEQQAQFTSDIQQLREVQATTENLLGRLAVVTTAGFKELGEKVSAIADAQIRSEEKISALAEAQTHTDERLNIFINVVERYISKDQDGK